MPKNKYKLIYRNNGVFVVILLLKEIAVGLLFTASVFYLYLEIKQDRWPHEGTEGL